MAQFDNGIHNFQTALFLVDIIKQKRQRLLGKFNSETKLNHGVKIYLANLDNKFCYCVADYYFYFVGLFNP